MIRRGPKFQVVTNACVGLAIVGVGVRIAARFLPERQPNRLAVEYGTYTNTAARERVDWYPLSEEPFQIAKSKNKLVLVDLGDMYSRSGRVFRYAHLSEPEFYRLINNQYIGVKVDAMEEPAFREMLNLNTETYAQASRMLVMVLDWEGRLIDETALRTIATISGRPGMQDWLSEIAHQFRDHDVGLEAAATRNMDARARLSTEILAPMPLDESAAEALFNKWKLAFESGVPNRGLLPVSAPLFDMLFAGNAADIAAPLLLQLFESPCYDHCGDAFFSGARGALFHNPSYGKLSGANGLLASTYARVGSSSDAPIFKDVALKITNWLINSRLDKESGLFMTGIATDEYLEDGSVYYDVAPSKLPDEVIGIAEVETEDRATGPVRLVPVRNFNEAVSAGRVATLNRLRVALRGIAKPDRKPVEDNTTYADQNGMVIASLFVVGVQANDSKLVEAARAAYTNAKRVFVQPFGDVLHAPQGGSRTTGYSGDYAWLARAAIENYLATGDESALEDAQRMTDRLLELFADPTGAIASALGSEYPYLKSAVPCFPITDFFAPSTNAVVARNLSDLSAIFSSARYREAASKILDAFARFEQSFALPHPGYVQSALHFYRPAVLVKNLPHSAIAYMQRQYPTLLCAPMYSPAMQGYYISHNGNLKGPMPTARLSSRLVDLGVSAAKQRTQ